MNEKERLLSFLGIARRAQKLSMGADGSYVAKMDITGLDASDMAYYTRISADLENFDDEWISSADVETGKPVTVGGRTYELVVGTDKNDASSGYGTVSVLCREAADEIE